MFGSKYPVPSQVGGQLIRKVIAGLREAKVKLPITSDILIATSGGVDSVALAHLLMKYGRRVAAPGRLALLHVNHGWRGEASDGDAEFVRELASRFGVRVLVRRPEIAERPGESREEVARTARQKIFRDESESLGGAPVLTAHHADDLAETVLWRLLTGAADTHGEGIRARHGIEVRPLLRVRKAELRLYLLEEEQGWREDATNGEGKLLRSRLRLEVMPALERLFPKGIEHLGSLAFEAQPESGLRPFRDAIGSLEGRLGMRLRRPHWLAIGEKLRTGGRWRGELHLPEGWKIRADTGDRWVIEKLGAVSPGDRKTVTERKPRSSAAEKAK